MQEELYINETDKNFYNNYLELLNDRLVHSTLSTINIKKNKGNYKKSQLKNCSLAFKMLTKNTKRKLSDRLILRTADMVNATDYIPSGYRKSNKIVLEANIPIANAKTIRKSINNLIDKYEHEWNDYDPFLKEAMFHIDFIRIYPFEDGNERTAKLILNYNLLKQKIYPVIITDDYTLEYQRCINTLDYEALASIFKTQSKKEKKIYNDLLKNYQN